MKQGKKLHKGIIAVLLAAMVLALLAGCQKKDDGNFTVTIALESNPTTGYSWATETSGTGKLTLISDEFTDTDSSLIAGAPSIQQFIFEPSAPGDVLLAFKYTQEWEGGEEAYSVTYNFMVSENLSVEFTGKTITALGDTPEQDLPSFSNPVISG